MRFLCLAFLLPLLMSCAQPPSPRLYAPTPLPRLSGVIHGQVEVSGEMVLADDLRIPAGSSLTFAPGSLVWVRPAESTKIFPEYLSSLTEILVRGTLRISGNRQNPVRFLPLQPLDPVADGDPLWAGIELLPGAVASLSGFELRRADVGLLVQQAEVSLSGGRLTGCRYGLLLQEGARLTAERMDVRQGEVGLFCSGDAVLALSDSSFSLMDEEGLYLDRQCTVRLRQVVSRDNDVGLVAADHFRPGLTLIDNRLPRLYLGGGVP
ncbi:hypothetical protein [Geothermobacter hydrogeniphilus]|uniref:Lipoprotein n=1 Tax=Geothermobacter hydrogeniphilus TaxID=1969733 RepID=A0A1X0Y8S9_9BACT|nr:hypothetical protein [Geothermobacter hydrogeniphilus]ORJ61585.1 hypothetical protein B5V00_05980 [Geothermobacter hydrogeniphilus]